MKHAKDHNPYPRFAAMIGISFVIMFGFMYAMVDQLANVIPNLNQTYMTGLMAAPMAILELIFMGMMYPNKKLNMAIIAGSVALLTLCWFGIRDQIGVGDKSFLRAMIPHHAGAILMCNQSSITDPEIKKLCGEIVEGQQREILQMKAILVRLN